MRQHEIEAILDAWQGKLGLSDWDIRIALIGAENIVSPSFGNVEWDVYHRVARIEVLDPDQIPEDLQFVTDPDPQRTVIHELLHLHLAHAMGEMAAEADDVRVEQTINAITYALLDGV